MEQNSQSSTRNNNKRKGISLVCVAVVLIVILVSLWSNYAISAKAATRYSTPVDIEGFSIIFEYNGSLYASKRTDLTLARNNSTGYMTLGRFSDITDNYNGTTLTWFRSTNGGYTWTSYQSGWFVFTNCYLVYADNLRVKRSQRNGSSYNVNYVLTSSNYYAVHGYDFPSYQRSVVGNYDLGLYNGNDLAVIRSSATNKSGYGYLNPYYDMSSAVALAIPSIYSGFDSAVGTSSVKGVYPTNFNLLSSYNFVASLPREGVFQFWNYSKYNPPFFSIGSSFANPEPMWITVNSAHIIYFNLINDTVNGNGFSDDFRLNFAQSVVYTLADIPVTPSPAPTGGGTGSGGNDTPGIIVATPTPSPLPPSPTPSPTATPSPTSTPSPTPIPSGSPVYIVDVDLSDVTVVITAAPTSTPVPTLAGYLGATEVLTGTPQYNGISVPTDLDHSDYSELQSMDNDLKYVDMFVDDFYFTPEPYLKANLPWLTSLGYTILGTYLVVGIVCLFLF